MLFAPGLYIAGDDVLDALSAYARAGGHLIIGIRTGYGDTEARARAEVAPARLSGAAGVTYEEYSNLTGETPVTAAADGALQVPGEARATGWADGLELAGAQALVRYCHPHFGRWPAITTHRCGAGRVTYVGTVPNRPLAAALAAWASPAAAGDPWLDLPVPVTSTSARNRYGQRLRFIHNWSWENADLQVPVPVTDVLDGTALAVADRLLLAPWDVKVLLETAPGGRARGDDTQ